MSPGLMVLTQVVTHLPSIWIQLLYLFTYPASLSFTLYPLQGRHAGQTTSLHPGLTCHLCRTTRDPVTTSELSVFWGGVLSGPQAVPEDTLALGLRSSAAVRSKNLVPHGGQGLLGRRRDGR